MNSVLTISAYRFVTIDDPHGLRPLLAERAGALKLLGTILLATEGLNLFLAGAPDAIGAFLSELRGDPRFASLPVRQSWSGVQPFRKLLVKVKREIIRMDQPAVQPVDGRAPAVDPLTVKRWLDQGHDDAGRPVVMLDTRNAFEADHGTFDDAIDWRLGRFSDFPAALNAHKRDLEGKTVVSFCTGGIRCEKAAIAMREAGVEHAWQLDGGILGYFERSGAAHFRGRCFVFDQRELLDAALTPAGAPHLSTKIGSGGVRRVGRKGRTS